MRDLLQAASDVEVKFEMQPAPSWCPERQIVVVWHFHRGPPKDRGFTREQCACFVRLTRAAEQAALEGQQLLQNPYIQRLVSEVRASWSRTATPKFILRTPRKPRILAVALPF